MITENFPIIELSTRDGHKGDKAQEIAQACKTWGFMILAGQGTPKTKISGIFQIVLCSTSLNHTTANTSAVQHQEFCKKPLQVKLECIIDERQADYDQESSKKDSQRPTP